MNVGYSAEYRHNQTNMALLRTLAKLPAKDGPPGELVEVGLGAEQRNPLAVSNPFAVFDKPIDPDEFTAAVERALGEGDD